MSSLLFILNDCEKHAQIYSSFIILWRYFANCFGKIVQNYPTNFLKNRYIYFYLKVAAPLLQQLIISFVTNLLVLEVALVHYNIFVSIQ